MTLTVQNYPELFLTIVSFIFYEYVWYTFAATGLTLIPFILIIKKQTLSFYIKKGTAEMAEASLRGVPAHIIGALIVMVFVYLPFVKVDIDQIKILPYNIGSEVVESEQEQQSIDGVSKAIDETSIRIPIFIQLTNEITTALAHTIINKLPDIKNTRQLEGAILTASVVDPVLLKEVQLFTKHCYIPSKNKYDRYFAERPSEAMLNILEDVPEDTGWIGSRIFNETYGLYAKCNTTAQCELGQAFSLPWDSGIDRFPAHTPGQHETNEMVSCGEWWMEPEIGLRDLLLEHIEEEHSCSIMFGVNAWCDGSDWANSMKILIGDVLPGQTGRFYEDAALRHFLRNSHDRGYIPSAYSSGGYADTVKNVGTFFGVLVEQFKTQTMMQAVKISLPIVQTVLFMVVICLLPFYALISRFDMEKVELPIITLFMIKMLPVFWALVNLIDEWGLEQMGMGEVWASAFMPFANGGIEASAYLQMWNLVVVGLYIGFPLIGFAFLAKASSAAVMGDFIGTKGIQQGGGNQSQQVGQTSSNATSNIASNAGSAASRSVSKKIGKV